MHVVTFVEVYLYEETLRFVGQSEDAPAVPGEEDYLPIIPSLLSMDITPTRLAPGESIGQRETCVVTLRDHKHDFDGTDYDTGTLWGKIRARYPVLRGYEMIVRRGEVGQHLGEMESRTYYLEGMAFNGDTVTLTGKDPLRQIEGNRAQAPEASRGRLLAGISDVAASLTLTPAGVGNAFYRTAGHATVGGREIVEYTRSGDAVTLVTRAAINTEASDHDTDASFQEVLEFNTGTAYEVDEADFNAAGLFVPSGETWLGGAPAEIIAYLLVLYARIPPALIPLDLWYAENTRQYSATIAQPEAVSTLVNELIQQAGLIVWYDSIVALVNLRSLLNFTGSAQFDQRRVMMGTYDVKDQPDRQANQVWLHWGRINPLKPVDELENYRAIQLNLASVEYPATHSIDDPQAIRTITGRWVNTQANAEFVGRLMLARYATPPRLFSFAVFRADPDEQPALARRCRVGHWSLQDEDGIEQLIAAQIVSIKPNDASSLVQAEESFLSSPDIGSELVVYIDVDTLNANLRELYDQQYTAPDGASEITFIVVSGVKVGSSDGSLPSLDVGDWPEVPIITLRIDGAVYGAGGYGGGGYSIDGGPGGTAIYSRFAIDVTNNGTIAGGGGGGGGGPPGIFGDGGGGGAGYLAGAGGIANENAPGFDGHAGTLTTGGQSGLGIGAGGGAGGNGGNLATAGSNGQLSSGGAAGVAVDGASFLTITGGGSIIGAQVN